MAVGTRKASRTKQPVTQHPLFAPIVALWFCALFGLGSLAIRVTLLENAVVASGIDLIVPAAAPPLGITARILLALTMGMVGALIGFALGTRMGRARSEPAKRRRTTLSSSEPPPPRRSDRFTPAGSPPPRPLSAFEELGDHAARIDTAEPEAVVPRRRALALAESTEPDYARISAPLPGGEITPPVPGFANDDPGVLDLSEMLPEENLVPDDKPVVPPSHAAAEQPQSEFSEPDFAPALSEAAAAPAPRLFDQGGPARRFAQPDTTASWVLDEPPTSFGPAMPRLMAADPTAAAADLEGDDRGLPPRNLGRRFGAVAATSEPTPASEPESKPVVVAPEPQPQPEDEAQPIRFAASSASGSAAERLRSTPLENLSQLELIERLALSMQQRRAAAEAAATTPAAVEASAPPVTDGLPRFGFEPRTPLPLDAPPPTFAATLAAAPIPTALRPISLDPEPAEEESIDDIVPRFSIARPASDIALRPEQSEERRIFHTPAIEEAEEAEDAVVESEEFSSLLDLGRAPPRQPLVRIEEPVDEAAPIEPVVVFPGHGSRPFAAPPPTPAATQPELPPPSEPGLRRFDAPAAQSAQAAPSATITRQDPEETDRALRAALATLQRMSGAA